MTVKDVLYSILNRRGMKISDFASDLGADRRNIHTTLSRNEGMGIKVETLLNFLDALDCELTITDTETGEDYLLDGEAEGIDYERNKR